MSDIPTGSIEKYFRLNSDVNANDMSRSHNERILFPGGIVCKIEPHPFVQTEKRIEVFGLDSAGKLCVRRNLFVAYAANRELIGLAQQSNSVVEVRSVSWTRKSVTMDRLILKGLQHGDESFGKLLAPSRWMAKMDIDAGERVIVSNTMTIFMPAPL